MYTDAMRLELNVSLAARRAYPHSSRQREAHPPPRRNNGPQEKFFHGF
jgi:hypothetical protein